MARTKIANATKNAGVDLAKGKDSTVVTVVTMPAKLLPNIVELGTYKGRPVRVQRKVAEIVTALDEKGPAMRAADKRFAEYVAGRLRKGYPLDPETEMRCRLILRRAA